MRWPWQTAEDRLIDLIDRHLEEARREREQAQAKVRRLCEVTEVDCDER